MNTKKKTLLLVQFSIMLAIEAVICFTPLGSVPLAPPLIVATLGMIPVVITAIILGTAAGSIMGFFAGLFSFLVWTFMPPSIMAFVFTPFASSIGDIHGNFWSLIICFVPRVLVGTVSGLLYGFFRKRVREGEKMGILLYGLGALAIAVCITVILFIIGYLIYGLALHLTADAAFVWVLLISIAVILTGMLWYVLARRVSHERAGDFIVYCVPGMAGSLVNTILVLGGIYLFFGANYATGVGISYSALLGVLSLSVITNGLPEAVLAAVAALFICKAVIRRRKIA